MATKKTTQNVNETWEATKSGGYKLGNWYASPYITGWYFVSANHVNMGPYKSFEDGLKEWKKVY